MSAPGAAASAQAPSRCGGGLPEPRTAGAPGGFYARVRELLVNAVDAAPVSDLAQRPGEDT